LEITMRRLFIAFVCSIASVACMGMAVAKDLKLTRDAKSGVDSRIAYERAWDRDCKAVPVTVAITQQPKNGTVSVVQGTSTIPTSTPRSGGTDNCAGKTVAGNEIMYRSNAGFRGTDTVVYDAVRNNVGVGTTTITINVK
jgi:hypothetical protein